MKHILIIALLTLSIGFAVSAQQKPEPMQADAKPTATPLPALILTQDQIQRLYIVESDVNAAQQALNAARARKDAFVLQLFLEKGGTLADYDPEPRRIGQEAFGFVSKAKPEVKQ